MRRVIRIRDADGVGIPERRGGLEKVDAMLAEIAERFRLVPGEAEHEENLSATLLRALPNESRLSRAALKKNVLCLSLAPRRLQALVRQQRRSNDREHSGHVPDFRDLSTPRAVAEPHATTMPAKNRTRGEPVADELSPPFKTPTTISATPTRAVTRRTGVQFIERSPSTYRAAA